MPGSALLVVADPKSLFAEVHVDEADVANVHIGQTAEIVAVAYPDQPLAGTVAFIANTARRRPNRHGLSFRVRIRLASDSEDAAVPLKPGMSCRSEIFQATEGAVLSAPAPAIVSEDDPMTGTARHFAYVVEVDDGDARRGAVHQRSLALGRADDEFQEVRSGLAIGDQVVVGPGRTLRHLRGGDVVEIESAP